MTFALSVIFYLIKNKYLYSITSGLLIIVAVITLIGFFSTYIYELPTHHCPFCMLQKDYNYIGYLLYIVLFLGTFYGMLSGFEKNYKKDMKLSFYFITIYTILISLYPIIYIIKNKTTL
jgi:hypothetical protein